MGRPASNCSHGVGPFVENLTQYDAAYLALAEMLEAVLVTGDWRLAKAPGIKCRIDVIGQQDVP